MSSSPKQQQEETDDEIIEPQIVYQGRMQVFEPETESEAEESSEADEDVLEALGECDLSMLNTLLGSLGCGKVDTSGGMDTLMSSIVNSFVPQTNPIDYQELLRSVLQQPKKPQIVYVTIEGNIGSGKSTMIGHIRERFPDYRIVDEPVHIWQALKDEANRSLLELFYTDKKRWSYTFQSSAFITRIMGSSKAIGKATEDIKNKQADKLVILSERSILTDRHVFASMLRDDNSLNPLEWELYTYWFDHFSKDITLDGIIYVTTDSNVCSDRIKTRGRQGEEGIPQEYLDQLTKYHEQWLSSTNLPVLRITSDVEELTKVEKFIDSLFE